MKATCCNWCGCSVLSSQGHNHIGDEFIVVGGYDSTPGNGEGALDDMDRYSFILCEFCLDHLFQMFRVPPNVEPEWGGSPIQFRPAHVRVKEDAWRHQKVRFLVEEKRRSDLRPSSTHESALVSGALDAQADAEKRLFAVQGQLEALRREHDENVRIAQEQGALWALDADWDAVVAHGFSPGAIPDPGERGRVAARICAKRRRKG